MTESLEKRLIALLREIVENYYQRWNGMDRFSAIWDAEELLKEYDNETVARKQE